MGIEQVRAYFSRLNMEERVLEFDQSSATVDLAAQALGVVPGRIAKTLSFLVDEDCVLILAAGDAKIDNRKFKDVFSCKAKMLTPDQVLDFTGHPVGGVCPFALARPDRITVYLDISLRQYQTVFPAAGSGNSAIELTIPELETYAQSTGFIDVTKPPESISQAI